MHWNNSERRPKKLVMLVNFQGGKDYTDPGQLKEDFFRCVLFGLLWILLLKTMLVYNIPSPPLKNRIGQLRTRSPFLPTATFWVPPIFFPSTSSRSETGFSPKFHPCFGCLRVWWKSIYSNLCYFEICLLGGLHRTWEKRRLYACCSSVGDFCQRGHVSLCFQVWEIWFFFFQESISYCHFRCDF